MAKPIERRFETPAGEGSGVKKKIEGSHRVEQGPLDVVEAVDQDGLPGPNPLSASFTPSVRALRSCETERADL